jgi:uncharacterized membrane protein
MSVVDAAKDRVKQLIEKVSESAEFESQVQAITIARPKGVVVNFFEDADRLSQVFGDVASVQSQGPLRMRWTFANPGGSGDAASWDCVVRAEGNLLRFVDADPQSSTEVVLDVRDAPQDRGTEVIARVSSPAPGTLTGAAAFKALYRARALLQTGEVPTIRRNPSARASER